MVLQSGTRLFPLITLFTELSKLGMINLGSVDNKFNLVVLRNTWSGANDYAWDGKGLGLESDRTCFFFQTGNIPFRKKLSADYLSAYILSA